MHTAHVYSTYREQACLTLGIQHSHTQTTLNRFSGAPIVTPIGTLLVLHFTLADNLKSLSLKHATFNKVVFVEVICLIGLPDHLCKWFTFYNYFNNIS